MVKLLKVHGSENQFFILDQTILDNKLSDSELKNLAINFCKNILNGADGLLVIDTSDDCLGKMRVINADGSEAKMCGNGLRTVSRYLSEKYQLNEFHVETLESNLSVKKAPDFYPGVPAFSVEISPISFKKTDLPFSYKDLNEMINEEIPEFVPGERFSAIAVPNPHLISFVSNIQHDILNHLGQKLNSANNYFPEGVNISFAKILDKNKLFVQTFERGVGFTNACGTGMSATSLVFALLYPDQFDSNKDITVYNPGGMVKTNIELNPIKELSKIHLIGNATFTHNIEVSEEALHQNQLDDLRIEETGEEKDYQAFVKSINR
ncbi:diaminopimelate epimerase [Companilactobacillus paralimentarius DSM 13238 = JCM 10415]|jgi:diaminopimelate epimerase|uniref:Diaminopimelate epimerase n=1 Tax=Companilactobacillus paralimentarius DSM 13238 = JCM 10415 TaxID=1122151 RepID=A0A0R1PAP2_9LACO|nr:diaminopimelate epimerase [Companilactobacillus paralimentarius]KAE9565479.1 diaminopimelate epimerase [Companilactobacillus paralimentarius]KRL29372.1 diaminopimelate epimerase [Companilactobacillus paralimentarius DSM 13238 = JCM 10415]MDR4934516.1 diaminopimelate epimerase [Companilactobacillus paralimentarius]QFR68672.1 diaminopimelate epimerase [Companilactobacillus paralimentarius]